MTTPGLHPPLALGWLPVTSTLSQCTATKHQTTEVLLSIAEQWKVPRSNIALTSSAVPSSAFLHFRHSRAIRLPLPIGYPWASTTLVPPSSQTWTEMNESKCMNLNERTSQNRTLSCRGQLTKEQDALYPSFPPLPFIWIAFLQD